MINSLDCLKVRIAYERYFFVLQQKRNGFISDNDYSRVR